MTTQKNRKTIPILSSFPPVSGRRAKVLILGSMPGIASLAAGQYYAHPRNHFWKIMGDLIGAGPDIAYPERLEILKANRIALWDTLQCCARPGSLDSNITQAIANDFPAFFTAHENISHIFFNGAPPEKFFMRLAVPKISHLFPSPRKPGLRGERNRLVFTRLPSTSPANANYSFEKKLKEWRRILSSI